MTSTGANPRPPWTMEDAETWLSHPRLSRYLSAAFGDLRVALRLYEWNALTAGAALVEVGYLEVAMRNAYVDNIARIYPDWMSEHSSFWTRRVGDSIRKGNQEKANRLSLKRLDDAERYLRGTKTPDRIIANTSLGFWTSLTDSEREPTMWTNIISEAYPAKTSRGQVHRLATNVNDFRNRLTHHEPLFSRPGALCDHILEVRRLHHMIHPESANRVGRTNTKSIISQCPIKGLASGVENL